MLNEKSHTCIHTKSILGHDLSVWSIMKNSSFLLLYFFHLFLSFSLFYIFFRPPFLWIFFRVINYCFYTISSIYVWVRCWESFFSVLPLQGKPRIAGVSVRQKDQKTLTMLCTIHILRGNKVITVLLVKLFTCQITSNHPVNKVLYIYIYILVEWILVSFSSWKE